MKNQFLLIAAIAVFAFSCESDNDSVKNTSIYPIEKGNSWTYQNTNYNMGKENIDTSSFSIGELITINGVSGYQMLEKQQSYNKDHIVYLANNDKNGNLLFVGWYSDVDTLIQPVILYKKDIKKGEKWIVKSLDSDGDKEAAFSLREMTYTCTNTDTTIVTPKGSFKCIAISYSHNNGADLFYLYLSPGIGEVYSKHYEDSKLFSFSILIDYKLK